MLRVIEKSVGRCLIVNEFSAREDNFLLLKVNWDLLEMYLIVI